MGDAGLLDRSVRPEFAVRSDAGYRHGFHERTIVAGRISLLLAALLVLPVYAGTGNADGRAPLLTPGGIPVYGYDVIDSFPHDPNAYTQGLVYHDGFLYEGTGLYGGSSLRKVVLETGEVVKRRNLPSAYFGEGITVRSDTIYQLTWRYNTGFVWEEGEGFELIETFTYPTQGWGLTHDDTSLIMSDGSDKLYFRDPHTYEEVGRLYVTAGGAPVRQLNELEVIRGLIYANIWHSDSIAVIEPGMGEVVAWLDLSGISPGPSYGVLNGIAFDKDTGRLFVTGKKWPTLFEIWVDLLDRAPEIVTFSPPSPVYALTDSPLVFSIEVEDRDPGDSLLYTWSVDGVVDPSARDSCFTYASSVSTVDTVAAGVTDGILSDSVTWIVHVETSGREGDGGVLGGLRIDPNPLRASTSIGFRLRADSGSRPVRLSIHDVSGRRLATLIDSDVGPGDHRIGWDGRDSEGKHLSSGLYFAVLESGDQVLSRKITVLK